MHVTREVFFGCLAAIINYVGFAPYLIDIVKRKTKPERTTWWIYSTLFILLFAAQHDAHAGWLLVATGTYIFTSVSIALLSIKYGYGTFHRRHFIAMLVAFFGLVLWQATNQPLVAIVMVIVVDFAGFWLTIIKTWHAPHSETLISWQLALVSYWIGLFSISNWSTAVLIYPIYAILGGSAIVWVITHRRKMILKDPNDF